jgi:hypothetical protein
MKTRAAHHFVVDRERRAQMALSVLVATWIRNTFGAPYTPSKLSYAAGVFSSKLVDRRLRTPALREERVPIRERPLAIADMALDDGNTGENLRDECRSGAASKGGEGANVHVSSSHPCEPRDRDRGCVRRERVHRFDWPAG